MPTEAEKIEAINADIERIEDGKHVHQGKNITS